MPKEQSAEQTEKPTPKRLRDARQEGDVSKSRELSSTAVVLCWLVMAWLVFPIVSRQVGGLMERTLDAVVRVGGGAVGGGAGTLGGRGGVGGTTSAGGLGGVGDAASAGSPGGVPVAAIVLDAFETLVVVLVPLLAAAALTGVLVEFLQVGALFVPKRVLPRGERLNPVEGVKRMFSQENLLELVKSLLKTLALLAILWLVLLRLLPEILRLPGGAVKDVATAHWHAFMWVGVWTVCVFALIAAVDSGYQRLAFTRRLRMSRRDIRREMRDTEGDPLVKGRRKQLHQDWAQQNMLAAVRTASAVVVNPEHIAVAIWYQPGETELPVVCAKGEDYEALLIREVAEEAGVPVLRNVELARGLHEAVGVDEYVKAEFFQAVAELLRWAEAVRRR